jgi:hypothetical protein
MQDRYAGDIGDFVKLGLLRALSPGQRLGVAWYRFPNESHNDDGRHISYLEKADLYGSLDPNLLAHLRTVVRDARSISSLMPLLEGAISSDEALDVRSVPYSQRREWRQAWFSRVLDRLSTCNLVFADPDNGIVDDMDRRKGSAKYGKQIPLSEVRSLAENRCAIIYHHNTRRRGGHDAEVDNLLNQIGLPGLAVRATAFSPRTFFILNPDKTIEHRAREFCYRWRSVKVRLHE